MPQLAQVNTGTGTYWKSDFFVSDCLKNLRGYIHDGMFKSAQSGGGNEEGFEQAFSSLAYAYLKDKAPRLLDFMVGFQLVERNDDNTKAMGIFGFRVGQQWLYAPVFFLNGDLKGHELLYIKKQDSFVPMKENWVNYLMSRKPHILGERSEKNTYQLGGYQPDIYNFSVSPSTGIGKRGCDEWARPMLPLVAAFKAKMANALFSTAKPGTKIAMDQVVRQPFQAALAEVAGALDLNKVLPQNFGLLKNAFIISQSSPSIKKAFDKFYGADCFTRWGCDLQSKAGAAASNIMPLIKKASTKPQFHSSTALMPTVDDRPEHPEKSGALRVYVYESVAVTRNLSDETNDKDELTYDEKADLSSDGYLVKDKRTGEEISKAYNTQVEQKLTNPHETGLYDVLEKPGTFDRMLCISNPHSVTGRRNHTTVVRLSGGTKDWLNSHRTNLWASRIEDRQDYEKWFEGLGGPDTLKKGGMYLAIDKGGSGTVPFEVRETYGDGGYKVDFRDSCNYKGGRPSSMPPMAADHDIDGEYISPYGAKMFVDIEGKRGTKLRAIQGELRIPGTFKFMELKAPPKPKKEDGMLMPCCIGSDYGSEEDKPINPGKIEDIQMLFHEKTARLKIYDDHNEVSISSPLGDQRMTKRSAVISLIRDHGFTKHTAECMLKQAEYHTQRVYRVQYAPGFGDQANMVKSAMPNMSMLAGGPNAPSPNPAQIGIESFGNRSAVAARYPDEQNQLVDQMDSSYGDPQQHDIWSNYSHEDFNKQYQQASQAGQQGQKEVFDTAMVSGMLKAVRQDSLVDRYLGDLMKALDKLGRILFMFYWHQEEFEDRYGKQDLPELEDSLRNAFEVLGDVVLFLKEKSVEPTIGDMGDPDIEEAARN